MTDKRKKTLISKILREARSKAKGAKAKQLELFIRQFFAYVPPRDTVGIDAKELFEMAYSAWQFIQDRNLGREKLRIQNKIQDSQNKHTVIEIINDDMPFLVDSLTAELNRLNINVHKIIHPLFKVKRTAKGRLQDVLDVAKVDQQTPAESFMYLEITEQTEKKLTDIKKALEKVLADVRAAVTDWLPMRERLAVLIEELHAPVKGIDAAESEETRAFLRWLYDNHFTFLGTREYDYKVRAGRSKFVVKKDSGLGVLRDPKTPIFGDPTTANPMLANKNKSATSYLLITKSNHRSVVHRSVHMDSIGIKRFDAKGRVIGERIFVGLFTSSAYNRSPRDIPLLRRRLQLCLERAGFPPASHDGKALMNILETYPRDELFQISDDQLYDTAIGILHLQERKRTTLFVRHDDFGRFVSCLVFVPKDRFTTDLREKIQDILKTAFDGRISAFSTQLGDHPLARLNVIVTVHGDGQKKVNIKAVEDEIARIARSWGDHLMDQLTHEFGENRALDLRQKFGNAFGPGYREEYSPELAMADIDVLCQVMAGATVGLNLYQADGELDHRVQFKVYHPDQAIPLSDVLPLFEHMGFRVVDESPHEIRPRKLNCGRIMIHDFGLETKDGSKVNLKTVRENFQDAFLSVWSGVVESDGFNALVPGAGLTWREVIIVRAYCKFLRQSGIAFSQNYMEQTLSGNAKVTRDLVALFMVKFDPAAVDEAKSKRLRTRILKNLESVVSADEDRIFRRYLNLIENTLRTNYFQTDDEGAFKSYLSLKLNSGNIDELPLPRPYREIFVYSPRMEGVHLRFGKVARGGLRWSDRREDFRTEILGLVKAQQVKNAVIVPVGSKGGFVLKKPPTSGGREAFLAEGIACYKILISGLLDLTDNYRGNLVIAPKQTVRLDEDDPYLVVAADKGTATFSDIANGVSEDYGFWLGDAFASGGSQGYDHKKMGITARGAWESVKRHFREMGRDIQQQEFNVVGVGDMSGDVFGNGMLLSKHIRLQAAFNHLHIFVDPEPNVASSFAERKRLFNLPRSSWGDYNEKLLSKGGAIFDRQAKSLTLSPEIRKTFNISKKQMTPNELLKTLLTVDVDLLWFGGIGTYIKASHESHLDAGDRANDVIRVNGEDLKCKVVGEGANLGCTQLGRIEYAAKQGRLNTDSIDNSAGVDTSDHEVNIKILIDADVAAGKMTVKSRNTLLASMTDEVAKLVLVHNYSQTQALTLIQSRGVQALDNQKRLLRYLEKADRLNRQVEFLPDDDTLNERAMVKQGLYQPESSVLISYSKNWLYDELVASDLPDDAYLFDDLVSYFPAPLHKKFTKGIAKHRLRREIIATRATNSLVNRVGETFVSEYMEKTGRSAAQITRAYIITRQVFCLRDIWADIEALDNKVSAAVQVKMLMAINYLIEWTVLWLLRKGSPGLDMGRHIKELASGLSLLVDNVTKILPAHYGRDVKKRARPFMEKGVPEKLAMRVAGLVNLYSACDIVRLAADRKLDVLDVAQIYFAVGTRFKMGRLRAASENIDQGSHWNQLAVAALVEEIYNAQLALTAKVLNNTDKKPDAVQSVEIWASANRSAVEPMDQMLTELWATDVNDLAMVAVASRQIRAMIDSGTS